ncbi:hypothetical protein MTR_0899s0010 [Medicago truncatula]|uniref:Uncharacterized protein n=1 Tax=Medicago truncatula TaxID=3880 RepID=A0A072TE59_MEDTR|nr:hypothetical protein MTR_0899s0010 [Medicago truncatula]
MGGDNRNSWFSWIYGVERWRKYDLWPILENIMHNAEAFDTRSVDKFCYGFLTHFDETKCALMGQ